LAKRRVMFSFSSTLDAQALILEFGKQFNLKTNHEQAKIAEDTEWIELEVEAEDEDIDEALTWAISRGVRVEELSQEANSVKK